MQKSTGTDGEVHARLGQLLDFQGHQNLARRGGAGVEDVHIGVGVVLQPEAPRLGRRVVGAGEQGGKSDHIQVVGAAVKRLQILDGGRAGGLGSRGTLLHPPEQGTLVKGGIVYHDMLTHPDGQRDADKAVLPELGGR